MTSKNLDQSSFGHDFALIWSSKDYTKKICQEKIAFSTLN